jgi:hypothetical protein
MPDTSPKSELERLLAERDAAQEAMREARDDPEAAKAASARLHAAQRALEELSPSATTPLDPNREV